MQSLEQLASEKCAKPMLSESKEISEMKISKIPIIYGLFTVLKNMQVNNSLAFLYNTIYHCLQSSKKLSRTQV
jgi:hypothetical protein